MWTVELQDMTYDSLLFSRFWEKEGGMSVELGDDATYLVKRFGSISSQMSLGDVLESIMFYLFLL
jgi:hypothetical protein